MRTPSRRVSFHFFVSVMSPVNTRLYVPVPTTTITFADFRVLALNKRVERLEHVIRKNDKQLRQLAATTKEMAVNTHSTLEMVTLATEVSHLLSVSLLNTNNIFIVM